MRQFLLQLGEHFTDSQLYNSNNNSNNNNENSNNYNNNNSKNKNKNITRIITALLYN